MKLASLIWVTYVTQSTLFVYKLKINITVPFDRWIINSTVHPTEKLITVHRLIPPRNPTQQQTTPSVIVTNSIRLSLAVPMIWYPLANTGGKQSECPSSITAKRQLVSNAYTKSVRDFKSSRHNRSFSPVQRKTNIVNIFCDKSVANRIKKMAVLAKVQNSTI